MRWWARPFLFLAVPFALVASCTTVIDPPSEQDAKDEFVVKVEEELQVNCPEILGVIPARQDDLNFLFIVDAMCEGEERRFRMMYHLSEDHGRWELSDLRDVTVRVRRFQTDE